VYDLEEHIWPFRDIYVERKAMVVKDSELVNVPSKSEKVYELKDGKYIPITINILHPTFEQSFKEYKEKDKVESRALIRKIAGSTLVIFTSMLIIIGILRRQPIFSAYKGFTDLIGFGFSGIAMSIAVLTYTQYFMLISSIYMVGFILYIVYSSYRKHQDEKEKQNLANKKEELEHVSKQLTLTCDKIKSFTKWDKEEKEQINNIQTELTKKFVEKERSNG